MMNVVKYPKRLKKIFDKLIKDEIKPIIVGGYIREYFLNNKEDYDKFFAKDIDIELYNTRSFEQVEMILSKFGKPNNVGKSFGVIKLNLDDLELDFSLPRTENKVSSGHKGFFVSTHSKISYTQASSRRDFTINAIGYDVVDQKILDPHHGLDDLVNKKLKIINKKTFVEDPLRVLRAMQFCARFSLVPDQELIDTASKMCKENLLDELARERIYEEFKKLFLKAKRISVGLNFLRDVDGFLYFCELQKIKNYWDQTLKYIDNINRGVLDANTNITVVLALLSYEMDQKSCESFLYKITSKRSILKTIGHLHHINRFLDEKTDHIKYQVAKDLDLDVLESYLNAKEFRSKTLKKIKNIKPVVQGRDLLDVGFKKSKDFKDLLQLIYEVQISKLFSS